MKKVILMLFVAMAAFGATAQEKGAIDYNNDGVAAYKAKDYKSAFESFSKAIELYEAAGEAVTNDLVYNTGYSGFKAKKYEDAIPYFNKSIEAKFKASKPYVYLTQCYMKLKDLDNMEKAALAGLALYPDDKSLNKLAAACYSKQGVVYYNEGNKIKKTANESGMNESDPDAFNAEYERANGEFETALPYFEKSYGYNPTSKNTLKALANIYSTLKMDDKAAKIQGELDAM